MEFKTTKGLFVLKTHPYNENIDNVKISGNPEYTSPILNLFEEKKGKHDIDTGEHLGNQINCLFYDSKQGKFVKKLINKKLTNSLTFDISKYNLLSEIEFKKDSKDDNNPFNHKEIEKFIKKNLLYKKASLRSISIELTKKKVNVSSSTEKLVQTNHLDFLPPVMQIIGYRFSDEKKKFCDETGDLKLELKCKWFNHSSKTFSEEFLPYQALILINEINDEAENITGINNLINSNGFIQYPLDNNETFTLEDSTIKITFDVVIPKKIIFNHYYHEVQGFGHVYLKESRISDISKIRLLPDNDFRGETYPSYKNNKKINIFDCPFTNNTYMLVKYKDQFDRITDRVIRISEILIYASDKSEFNSVNEYTEHNIKLNEESFVVINSEKWMSIKSIKKILIEDKNVTVVVKANCLLRKGKIRHFRLDGFLSIQEIKAFEIEEKQEDGTTNSIKKAFFEDLYTF